jgi:hypothetical protein
MQLFGGTKNMGCETKKKTCGSSARYSGSSGAKWDGGKIVWESDKACRDKAAAKDRDNARDDARATIADRKHYGEHEDTKAEARKQRQLLHEREDRESRRVGSVVFPKKDCGGQAKRTKSCGMRAGH